jgi:phage shock protein PspC (stress-responsive transcriptional regulator)
MNDEAAAARGPSGPSQDEPASAPAAGPASAPAAEPASAPAAGPASAPAAEPGPATQPGPATEPPPWFSSTGAGPTFSTFSRDKLVRPRQGRYVAGVCGALARATNTDPVLWRVLFAVLGVISGVGVLLYLIGWLVMPAEGDTASPIESLLGKGRSGMTPVSVVLLGGAAVLSFAFIVQDGMRASLLACAVIVGAILLIKRSGGGHQQQPTSAFPATTPPAAPGPFEPGPFEPSAFEPAPFEKTAEFGAVPPTAMPAEPVVPPPPPPYTPPTGGYRPPFAPHGPYARPTPVTYPPGPPAPPVQAKPPKPPKPPRERSKLGRLTFFGLIMVIGVMAAIDMAGASIAVSAYFAAAVATIAAGLIIGAWLGRARGLIALGLIASVGLLISTGAERWGSEVGNSTYRPATLAGVADRYDFTAGNATLDLRQVDFAGQSQAITVTMKVGQVRVLVPANVDTTTSVQIDNGRAVLFDQEFNDRDADGRTVTDLGPDGAGGGTLKLDLQMDTGNVEVLR